MRVILFAFFDGRHQSRLNELNHAKRVVVLSYCDVDLSVLTQATGWSAVAT